MDVPDQWKPGQDGSLPGPRLVACVYQDTADSRDEPRDCLYTLSLGSPIASEKATKVSLLKASYIVQLYEAETAKPVGRLNVPGAESRPAVYEADDSSGVIFQEPDSTKLRAALRPHIERSIPA